MKLLIALATLFTASVQAAPSGGTWIGGNATTVRIDGVKRGVEVRLNPEQGKKFKSIGMVFYDSNGNATELELSASDPGKSNYVGSLTPGFESFIGFEIKIPVGHNPARIIRSEDLKKTD